MLTVHFKSNKMLRVTFTCQLRQSQQNLSSNLTVNFLPRLATKVT